MPCLIRQVSKTTRHALSKRQPAYADTFKIGRNCGAFGEGALALNANGSNQVSLPLGVQTLDAQKHHRRVTLPGNCKVRVEVMVQRDTNASVIPGSFQNDYVICLMQSKFGNMTRIKTVLAKDRRCTRGESLVQQQAFHATRCRLNRSSSTVAAA
jgi:hypothetical protein